MPFGVPQLGEESLFFGTGTDGWIGGLDFHTKIDTIRGMAKKKTTSKDSKSSLATAPHSGKAFVTPGPMISTDATAIRLRGGEQHNLKSIDVDLPLGKLIVVCGVSGSGKSSLAFETLYAEGQRRYIESFSAYTRQFLQRLDKPKFNTLEPLPPSIAITRDSRSRNNRSTVGTACEVLEYLRTAFASNAELYCHQCNCKIEAYSPETILRSLEQDTAGRCLVCFEITWEQYEDLAVLLADLQSEGFVRLIVNGATIQLGETEREILAERFRGVNQAYVLVDRLVWNGAADERWTQSIQLAWELASFHPPSRVVVLYESERGEIQVDGRRFNSRSYSPHRRCDSCGREYPEPDARLFHFNHPLGACPSCEGFGEVSSLDQNKIVPDSSLSLREGAIAPWRTESYSHELEELLALADEYEIPVDVPVSKLKKKHWQLIEEGVPKRKFGGLKGFFAWLERRKYKMHVRVFLSRWKSYALCPECDGKRLNSNALAYRWHGLNIAELCRLPVHQLLDTIESAMQRKEEVVASERARYQTDSTLPEQSMWLAAERHSLYRASEPVRQVISRLSTLQTIGLGYVSLDRPVHTLSSGEAQRVRLTSLLGSSLVDMLYVFDEPTVGLHASDVKKVAESLKSIRDRGNTVLLVEHEPDMIEIADHVIEIGPGAGERGGNIVFEGPPDSLRQSNTLTGRYLRGEMPSRTKRSKAKQFVGLDGARGRNLMGCNLRVPLGRLSCVVGPSGAGKSTLVLDTWARALEANFGENGTPPLEFDTLVGTEWLGGCRSLDQSPIPRSTRSTPATYSKAMDGIRDVFANTIDAKNSKLSASHFSFNSSSGRCETCEGLGYTTVEMQFMADVELPCTDCNGKRFQPRVLDVRFRDRNIHEIMQLSVDEAIDFFHGENKVKGPLELLARIGLGYLPLGQRLSTLSAGESMRLKLASIMGDSGQSKGSMLILMDEPTTGLHFADIDRLLQCIDVLLESGNTVVVIEHNEQFIRSADYVVEMGPGAGPDGGRIVSEYWNSVR